MEKRIEIFMHEHLSLLQNDVNNFLSERRGKLHETQFGTLQNEWADEYIIILTYTPEEAYEKDPDCSKQDENCDERIPSKKVTFWKQTRPPC